MRAVYSLVRVQLVYHDVSQVLEQVLPFHVVGQYAGMQHVGVRYHYMPRLAYLGPDVARGVAVVSVGAHVQFHILDQFVQLRQLILRKGFRGEKINRPRVRRLDDRVEHRYVVAERFSRSRWGHYHEIPACERRFDGERLVGVEFFNSARGEGTDYPGVDRGPLAEDGRARRQHPVRRRLSRHRFHPSDKIRHAHFFVGEKRFCHEKHPR